MPRIVFAGLVGEIGMFAMVIGCDTVLTCAAGKNPEVKVVSATANCG